jgi:hypothetical protein
MAEDVVLVEGEAVAQLEIGGDARASGDCVMPARLIKLISHAKARFWSEPYRPQGVPNQSGTRSCSGVRYSG